MFIAGHEFLVLIIVSVAAKSIDATSVKRTVAESSTSGLTGTGFIEQGFKHPTVI